jgi:diaminohydroxyphosphoribosylaminopyrimidine deaminase / 5-amino-6-(5-phosphoribosylamino)uracil reductase
VTRHRPTADARFLRLALRLARRAHGMTSPNPMVGAVLVQRNRIIGRGWHHRAGQPHAEIQALADAARHGHPTRGATLYVTLEPCCTFGRTPPCTDAIVAAGIRRVVVAATDPNPRHNGRGCDILRQAGIRVSCGLLAAQAERLNEPFNHWIVQRTPFVTVKVAMTLDGKIATATGESKWITGQEARAYAMELRQGADAILVGVNTVFADDPSLTVRSLTTQAQDPAPQKRLRRVVLDSQARTPLDAKLVTDSIADLTTIVVGREAPSRRVAALRRRARVLVAPTRSEGISLRWLLRRLGSENVTSLLVEGGGEVNASFLAQRLVHRLVICYAPKILGGRQARKAVAGLGARAWPQVQRLRQVEWTQLGAELLLTARVDQD